MVKSNENQLSISERRRMRTRCTDRSSSPPHSDLAASSSSFSSDGEDAMSEEQQKYWRRYCSGVRRMWRTMRAMVGQLVPMPHVCSRPMWNPWEHNYTGGSNRVTGTLFGERKGNVHFCVQEGGAGEEPYLMLEMEMETSELVKEMARGGVRIEMECKKGKKKKKKKNGEDEALIWSMYCNGRRAGYAIKRVCSHSEMQVLGLLRAMSMGAGVLPPLKTGHDEILFMRAAFQRSLIHHSSLAFYMINPDGTSGPELTIFLLRI